ncbi:hypothetical protein D3C85_1492080 [compost metagenome]
MADIGFDSADGAGHTWLAEDLAQCQHFHRITDRRTIGRGLDVADAVGGNSSLVEAFLDQGRLRLDVGRGVITAAAAVTDVT